MATFKRKITVRKGCRKHANNLLNGIDQSLDDRGKIKSHTLPYVRYVR